MALVGQVQRVDNGSETCCRYSQYRSRCRSTLDANISVVEGPLCYGSSCRCNIPYPIPTPARVAVELLGSSIDSFFDEGEEGQFLNQNFSMNAESHTFSLLPESFILICLL
jgi:hypothetical protein